MLMAEHVAAEVLRQQRLSAYAVRGTGSHGLSWLLKWLGLGSGHTNVTVH